MHFISLVASERNKGNSDLLSKVALKFVLENSKNSGETLYLKDFNIQECQGCMQCIFKNTPCKLNDDLYKLLEKIKSADALIFIAPTYVLSVPGALKVLLDRYLSIPAYFGGYKLEKQAISIGVASLPDWYQFQLPFMNLFLLCMGFQVVDSFMAFGAGQGEALLGDNIPKLKNALDKLCKNESVLPFQSQVSNHCPVDFSTLFERMEGSTYRCPVCLTHCEQRENGFYFKAEDLNNNRWIPHNVEDHFNNWIKKTGPRFKDMLKEIFDKKQQLGL